MDWSYIAGFFDQKGNINIIKVKGREYIQIRFYSDSKDILEKMQQFLECGRIYVNKLSKKNKRWHDRFELTITSIEDIFIVLSQILPFLFIKQAKVENLLINHKALSKFSNYLAAEGKEKEEEKETVSYIG